MVGFIFGEESLGEAAIVHLRRKFFELDTKHELGKSQKEKSR
jgi:hypothetical protein